MKTSSQQANRIVHKFGSAKALAFSIGRDVSVVQRWRNVGAFSRGLIPSSAVFEIIDAAEALGIKLTAEDWLP